MKLEVLEEETVYSGRIFDLKVHKIRLGSGRVIRREFVEHPGAVAIIAVKGDRILLIKQYRHPVRGWIIEIPAGTLEEGESSEQCARRELEEETGYRARKLKEVFKAYVAPGYSSELIHFFLAEELEEGVSKPEEDEITQVIWLDTRSVLEMISKGEVRDLKTISAVLWIASQGL